MADPEKLLAAVDRTLEEGQRLTVKLGQTESPKDQFFIKQELINWQEGLRALFLRVVKMCEKSSWRLPRFTEDVINTQVLRRLLERLSMENWSNLDDFASFSSEHRRDPQGSSRPGSSRGCPIFWRSCGRSKRTRRPAGAAGAARLGEGFPSSGNWRDSLPRPLISPELKSRNFTPV